MLPQEYPLGLFPERLEEIHLPKCIKKDSLTCSHVHIQGSLSAQAPWGANQTPVFCRPNQDGSSTRDLWLALAAVLQL